MMSMIKPGTQNNTPQLLPVAPIITRPKRIRAIAIRYFIVASCDWLQGQYSTQRKGL